MKKYFIVYFICVAVIISYYAVISMQKVLNKRKSNEILLRAHQLISMNLSANEQEDIENISNVEFKNVEDVAQDDDYVAEDEGTYSNDSIFNNNNIIGVLKIPSINVEAPVEDGTSQENMRYSVGHFKESNYWDGNIAFASHNGGTNAHFFQDIKFLKDDDIIEYSTQNGTKTYKVSKKIKIRSDDWSEIIGDSNINTITLITCIDGQPNYRLCVKGIEV